jgi:hypothetical protein
VAQKRIRTRRQHGREPASAPGQVTVSDRVNTTVLPVQPPTSDTPRDLVPREANRVQLRGGHDTVLGRSQRGDALPSATLVTFVGHTTTKVTRVRSRPHNFGHKETQT